MSYNNYSDDDSSWRSLFFSGSNITAKVKHVGSDKYRIIEDKDDGKYVGTYASDIFHCHL